MKVYFNDFFLSIYMSECVYFGVTECANNLFWRHMGMGVSVHSGPLFCCVYVYAHL